MKKKNILNLLISFFKLMFVVVIGFIFIMILVSEEYKDEIVFMFVEMVK